MKITVKDIAKQCNVSPGTVSRVLNNRTNVKEDTRQKVLAAIRDLNYDPFKNLPLVNNIKTRTIGLVLPSVALDSSHPFDNRAILTVQAAATERHYNCMLLTEDYIIRKTGEEFHQGSRTIPCDGLIFFCPRLNWDQYLKAIRTWEIPAVLIRRRTKVNGIAMINDNDFRGIQLVMEHLVSLGHTAIGLYSRDITRGYASGRPEGYKDFLFKHRMAHNPAFIYDDSQPARKPFTEWIQSALADRMTAVVCGDDMMAIDLIKQVQALGIKVPGDLAVTGYDNDYPAQYFMPGLTTVNIPVEEMNRMAIKLMDDYLQGINMEKVDIELENELVVRESSGSKKNADRVKA